MRVTLHVKVVNAALPQNNTSRVSLEAQARQSEQSRVAVAMASASLSNGKLQSVSH